MVWSISVCSLADPRRLFRCVVLMRRGISRQFGFVGFRTAEEARDAMEYFNGTYIKTTKITIVEAKSQNDPDLQATKRVKPAKRGAESESKSNDGDEPVSKAKKVKEIGRAHV